MKIIYLITIAFSLFISLSASQLICRIQGNYDEGILATGNVTISEEKDGRLSFSFSINQLPRGDHAVHVHEFGDLREPFGTNVGGHYKENSVCVGNLNQSISAHLSGLAQTETKATLSLSNKDSSITYASLVGRSIVIHKNPENCAGAPNPKIAVCVIGYLPPADGDDETPIANKTEVAVVNSTCVISPYSVSESPVNGTIYLIASGDKIELSWDKDLSEYYFNVLKYWDGKTPLNETPIPLTTNKTTVGDKILNGMTITLVKKETKQVQGEEPANTDQGTNTDSVETEIVYTAVGKCTIGIRYQPAPPTTTTTSTTSATTSTSTTGDGTTSTTGEGTSTTGSENTVVTTSSEATTTTTDSTTEVTTGTVPDPTSTTATSTSTTSTSDTATTATSTSTTTTGSPSIITPTQDQPGRGGLIVGIVMAAIVLLAMIIIMIRRNQQANKRAGFNRMYGEF